MRRTVARSLFALLALGLTVPAPAQTPYLVKDINTVPDPSAGSEPDQLTPTSDSLYFLGADDGNGFEPRRLQGGVVSLIQDFQPGPNPRPLTARPVAHDNRLFFLAGPGLWVTNGTTGGTTLLHAYGGDFSFVRELTMASGTLFFWASGTTGEELWKSDGTPAGTLRVASLYGGYLAAAGNRVFFVRTESATGQELWTSDGTEAGTHIVADVCPGPCPGVADPDALAALGDVLFFSGNDDVSGAELWRSDGTAAGTVLVKDIWPGLQTSSPRSLLAFGSLLLFGARDSELWRSDGTESGTSLVRPGVRVGTMHDAGGTAFFEGTDAATGTELWKTDSTAAGTTRLTDQCPGPCDFLGLTAFASLPGGVAFTVLPGTLWRSDGTAVGTVPVRTFASMGTSLARFGREVFIPADDGANGLELWRSDGSAAGTTMVANRTGSSSFWRAIGVAQDRYFFVARRPDLGLELWSSTGSEASTTFVDLTPGPTGTDIFGTGGALGADLLFGARVNEVSGLWTSDGTPAGTIRLQAAFNGSDFAQNGGVAMFGGGAHQLWRTDGTPAGTSKVADVGLGSAPHDFAPFGDGFVFRALGTSDTGLWRSDGTAEGTVRILDLPCRRLTVVEARIFGACIEPVHGEELWISDGTAAGTRFLKDVYPGPGGSALNSLTNVEGMLYFLSLDTLWRSDGSESGTQPLYSFTPLPSDLLVRGLTASNGVLYFTGWAPATGEELWRTDGTPTGTFRITDIPPGPQYSVSNVTPFAGGVVFTAATAAAGLELWKSDGTVAGTVPLPEIAPGASSSSPIELQPAIGHVFFHATDGTTGLEPWAVQTPSGTLSIGDVAVREGNGGAADAVFEVRLETPSAVAVTVAYTTVPGTAQGGADFTPRSGVLTFAPGEQLETVAVPVIGDLLDEADETFTVELSSAVGGTLADRRGVAIVVDDDSPRFALTGAAVTEGDSGTTNALFAVTLTTPDGAVTPGVKTVGYATSGVTAAPNVDFDTTAGTLTLPMGTASGTTMTVAVPVRGDTIDEPDELFHLRLVSQGDAEVPAAPAEGLIVDDDGIAADRPVELEHGSSVRATLAPPAGRTTDRDFYVLRQEPRASYELVVDETSGDAVPLQVERLSADGSSVLQSAEVVGTGAALSLRWQNSAASPVADQHISVQSAACGTSCGADDTYRARLYETTLRAPRYNNTGGQVTVAIVQNASSLTVSGRVYLWREDGLFNFQSFQLAPRATLVFNTSTLDATSSGALTVTHDGRYGSLAGKAVALEPSTGFSFDTPMSYRPR